MDAAPPSIPPVTGGGLGHPGHFAGQGNVMDVTPTGSRLVAIGYTVPAFRGATWITTDRQTWTLAELAGGDQPTVPTAIAHEPDGATVAVGRAGGRAAAWWTADPPAWMAVGGGDAFVEPPETRMTSVVATDHGFAAGGWAGLITQPGHPRFWTSPDGRTWSRAGDASSRDDGRVAAIAAGPGGLVAVGTMGPFGHATGGAAWRSGDGGTTWTRIDDPDLAIGDLRSVTASGSGYVAVGTTLDQTAAVVLVSRDGRAWDRIEDDTLTYHGLGVTMSDVVAGADGGLVAVGHFLFGQQYGQGTAWTSPDGRTWTRMPDEAAFGQAEPLAVIPDGGGYVAVGTVGAPDNFIPTVWLSPAR
ncbi:MAG TPA: hypothetical protein VFJ71_00515 [Candidatus Limnocylindrales bacterium]|nr:hypothetical protein [Candidatus Limnocylindrales bacterium]